MEMFNPNDFTQRQRNQGYSTSFNVPAAPTAAPIGGVAAIAPSDFFTPPSLQSQPLQQQQPQQPASYAQGDWFAGGGGGGVPPGMSIPTAASQRSAPEMIDPSMFVPQVSGPMQPMQPMQAMFYPPSSQMPKEMVNFDDEPPLLEELGINFQHIWDKTVSVLIPIKPVHKSILDDADLAGPFVFCLILGVCLLFRGKIHFGYIFGFGVVGCVSMYVVLNLMSQKTNIELYSVFSVLGYSLLPIVFLAALALVMNLRHGFGGLIALAAIVWCTNRATRFFEAVLEAEEQRFLIAYPVFLLYACFALITVF